MINYFYYSTTRHSGYDDGVNDTTDIFNNRNIIYYYKN